MIVTQFKLFTFNGNSGSGENSKTFDKKMMLFPLIWVYLVMDILSLAAGSAFLAIGVENLPGDQDDRGACPDSVVTSLIVFGSGLLVCPLLSIWSLASKIFEEKNLKPTKTMRILILVNKIFYHVAIFFNSAMLGYISTETLIDWPGWRDNWMKIAVDSSTSYCLTPMMTALFGSVLFWIVVGTQLLIFVPIACYLHLYEDKTMDAVNIGMEAA